MFPVTLKTVERLEDIGSYIQNKIDRLDYLYLKNETCELSEQQRDCLEAKRVAFMEILSAIERVK